MCTLIIQLKATNSSNNGIRTNHGDGIRTSPNDIIFTYHTDVICTNHTDTIQLSWWSRYDQSTFDIYSEKSEWFHGEKGIFDWKPFFKYLNSFTAKFEIVVWDYFLIQNYT